MKQNKNFKKDVFEKLDLLKSKFNLQEDVVSTLKINNYTLLAFLFIGIIGIVIELLLFVSLILMHTINALYTNAPLNILFVFLNVFLIFNNVYFITFCVVTYVIYKKEKRNIMFFAPLIAIVLTTISSILVIISLSTNVFAIDWAVFFIQLIASLISLFFFFNNYPNIRKKVDLILDKILKPNATNKENSNNKLKSGTEIQNKNIITSKQDNLTNKKISTTVRDNKLENIKNIDKTPKKNGLPRKTNNNKK
ncbi:MFS transporter [Malacoplasma iowae]|uniref:Uncharacterized protein n=1 Tax=Malacoplasma iowae 695 TaxID=1048830 RepID=A0A6P1LD88_MALIO|nr:hypothetical protein [Malacoplasma iowae]VEU63199.1 Uncharacterised protein [Mycoplasmopsis fermentans]EGZ31044.1 hypothetical protein GUU_03989 [Malacoplasma iowae 695]QHG89574.1 hypothetical protein EER00_01500 [Malacoplasma iowae 695]WPL35647.1 hypothetical protein QX180_04965 [Malacoplasma iowae]VEU71934.1 Uncharacterised protein [Malacoplasma iowae]